MKIAILKYSTNNLGDDIQSLAMERLLPHVDIRIDRDDLRPAREFDSDVKLILNGWFCGGSHLEFPPKTNAHCLYIGMFANDQSVLPQKSKLPVGCRDLWTYQLCLKHNIPAWLSWCATLTFDIPVSENRTQIVFTDIDEKYFSKIPEHIIRSSIKVSHKLQKGSDREQESRKLLDLYSKSKLVITSRLHALLPCLAMGIPVVLIPRQTMYWRFQGYLDFGWNLDDVCWDQPIPKVSQDFIRGVSQSFRKVIQAFIQS